MGTSHAAPQPKTVGWQRVVGSLLSPDRNPHTVVQATLTAAIPLIPGLQAAYAATVAVSEALRFASDVRQKGLEYAISIEAVRVTERFAVPSISDGLWKAASSRVDPEFTSGPFGRLAERAFKKTLTVVMTKGVRALEES